jgi:hypothetical protein
MNANYINKMCLNSCIISRQLAASLTVTLLATSERQEHTLLPPVPTSQDTTRNPRCTFFTNGKRNLITALRFRFL